MVSSTDSTTGNLIGKRPENNSLSNLSDQTYAALYDLAEALKEHPEDLTRIVFNYYDVFRLLNHINGGRDFRK